MKRTILLVVLFFLCQLVATGIGLVAVNFHQLMNGLPIDQTALTANGKVLGLILILSDAILFAIVVKLKWARLDRKTFTQVSFRHLLLCLPAIFSTMFLVNVLTEALQLQNMMETQFDSLMHNGWGLFSIILAAPFVEEMIFRAGIEDHLLKQYLHPAVGIFGSAILFGVIHGNPSQIPGAFLLGLLFGWLYYRTHSLSPTLLAHILNNGLAVALYYIFPDPQTTIQDILGGALPLWCAIGASVIILVVSLWSLQRFLPQYRTR